jgi:hypothetical protein
MPERQNGASGSILLDLGLERFQIFHQCRVFRFAQAEMAESVVAFDDIPQCREAAVMIKPVFRLAPQSRQWGGTVHMGWRTVRLEGIHTYFARSMKIALEYRHCYLQ